MTAIRIISACAFAFMSLSCGTGGRDTMKPICSSNCKKCDQTKGCMDCSAGKTFCEAHSDVVLQCNADGTVGAIVKECDTSNGETCKDGACLSPCEVAGAQHSYIGCDYWPVTLLNHELDPLFDFAVAVANPQQVGEVVTTAP